MNGENVKRIIAANSKTLTDVAEMIGMSRQSLSQSLSSTDIKTGLLERISAALGVPVAAFYGSTPATTATGTEAKAATVHSGARSATAVGDGSTAIHGTDPTAYLDILRRQADIAEQAQRQAAKSQEQVDRLLSIIEKLTVGKDVK